MKVNYGDTVASFFKRYRSVQGMSQAQLGLMLGVHAQYISNIERGINKRPIALCAKLKRYLTMRDQKILSQFIVEAMMDFAEEKMK